MGALDDIIGAAFIGCLFTAIFYGVTCLQAGRYFAYGPSDSRFIKCLVLLVVLLDTLHMAFISHFIYSLVVFDFGNPMKLGSTPWSLAASNVISLTSDTIIRMFFLRRVWYLSHRNVRLVTFLAIFVALAFGTTLGSDVNVITVSLQTDLQRSPKAWLLDFTLASSAIADFCIVAALSYLFYASRNEYFKGTNNMLNALCKYTVNTGLIATVWTVCALIADVRMPKTYVVLVFYLPLSKVYVNAFLGSLNIRDSLREMSEVDICTPQLSGTSVAFAFRNCEQSSPSGFLRDEKHIAIRIDSDIEISDTGSPSTSTSMRGRPVSDISGYARAVA